jgi:hypothetical protein
MTNRALGCLLAFSTAFALFLVLGYNPTMTHLARQRLHRVWPRGSMSTIEGAFPFRFTLPLVSAPGVGEISGLEVEYLGTWNPFRLTSQTGDIARGSAQHVVVTLFGGRVDVEVDTIRLSRVDAHWVIALHVRARGRAFTAEILMLPEPELDVTLADGVGVHATPHAITVRRGTRTVFHGERDGESFSLSVPDAAELTGQWRLGDKQFVVDDVVVKVLDEPERALGKTTVWWADGVRVVSKICDLTWKQLTLNGTIAAVPVRAVGVADGLRVEEPYPDTPLGPFRGVFVDTNAATAHVDVGTVPVDGVMGAQNIELTHGPVRVRGGEHGFTFTIDGGKYREFTCIHVAGHFDVERPHVVTFDAVRVRGEHGESFAGKGEFLLDKQQLKLSVDLVMETGRRRR